jgi:gliding motility-associated-like protein
MSRILSPRSFLVIGAAMTAAWTVAQPCATAFSLTTSPLPVNGTYSCGQSVTFCLTVTGWNSTNANWFHGVAANFGAGWDVASVVPGPPPATCGPSVGTWGWYTNVQGTSGGNIGPQGPGFFFDLNNDGDPGNNFGDFCVGATNWQFCWTIDVLSPPACTNGLDLGVTFNTFGDSETGSWGNTACGGDAIIPSDPAVILSCPLDAGTDGSVSICSSGTLQDLFSSLGGTPDAGGVWTDPAGNAHSGQLDPTTDLAGTYTYSLTNAAPPCTASSAVAVTIAPAADAGSNATFTRCSTAGMVDLFAILNGSPDAGGTWTDPSGSPFPGQFDPGADSPGTYTYTLPGVAPCPLASATISANVITAVDAGDDASSIVCAIDAPFVLVDALSGSPMPGGTWTGPTGGVFSATFDPSLHGSGDYTYTVPGTAPCPAANAVLSIVINQPPDAGMDGNVTLCRTAGTQALLALLNGSPMSGGSWSDPAGSPIGGSINTATAPNGTYTYSVNGIAPCPSTSSTLTITLLDQPEAGGDGELILCSSGAPASLTDGLTGLPDAGGSWTGPDGSTVPDLFTPSVDAPGTHTYTILAQAPCVASIALVEVIVLDQPDAGTDATLTVCSSNGPTDLLPLLGPDAQVGGTWTAPDGTTVTGTIDPSTAIGGSYTYVVSAPSPCITANATVELTVVNAPWAGTDASLGVCATGPDVDLFAALGGMPDVGGVWADPNGIPIGASFPANSASAGIHTYTVIGTAPCPNAEASVDLAVFSIPDAGEDADIDLCEDQEVPLVLLTGLGGAPDPGGVWTDPDGTPHGPSFQPGVDTPGPYTYVLSAPAPCPSATSTLNVSVVQPPPTGTSANLDLCSTDADVALLDVLPGSLPEDGSWTDPTGAAIPGTIDPSAATSGVHTYTLTATPPCTNGIHTVSISLSEAPDAGTDGSLTLCSSAAAVDLFSGLGGLPDTGGTWTSPNGDAISSTFNASSDAGGGYDYLVPGTGACANAQATVVVDVIDAAWIGEPGVVALCGADGPLDPNTWLNEPADLTGDWTDPTGSVVDAVDPSTAPAGNYTYTVAGTFPCPDGVTIIDVDIIEAPDAGADSQIERCSGDPVLTLTPTLLPGAMSGGQWSNGVGDPIITLDPAQPFDTLLTYTVQGTGPCSSFVDVAELSMLVHPLPVPSFTSINAQGCAPLEVSFLASTEAPVQTYLWSFGDVPGSMNSAEVEYTFVTAGDYSAELTVIDANGCAGTVVQPSLVLVSNGPEPVFGLSSDRISVEAPSFQVIHSPMEYEVYEWVLNGDTVDTIAPFTWTIASAEVGDFPICLLASDTLGCTNSVCRDILVDDALTVYVPNTFTPDGDDINDRFTPSVIGLAPMSYELIVMDRWGKLVFMSEEPSLGWNGGMNNSDDALPQGVYVWRLRARDQFGAERKEYTGTVTLLK